MESSRLYAVKIRPVTLIYFFILVWVLVSSLYYVGFLFSGEIVASHGSNFVHKVAKYVVALLLSTILMMYSRNFIALLFYFFFLVIIITFSLVFPESTSSMDLPLVIFSMSGLGLLLGLINERRSSLLIKVFVLSGSIVGCFSVIEVYYLGYLYQSYWDATDGVRSVSTLYNPNNLGLYVGGCLILMFFSGFSLSTKVLVSLPILFSFFMSGSRTAWLAFFLVTIIYCFFRFGKLSYGKLVALIFVVGLGFLMALAAFLIGGITIPDRLTDFQSASIRLERYYNFLTSFDVSYFFPDFNEYRSGLVSESSYFTLFNSLGVIGALLLFVLSLIFFRRRGIHSASDGWRLVFFYYVFAGFFENILNSFPNNQLLFISLGVFFTMRKELVSEKIL